jgi:hypothetical protein
MLSGAKHRLFLIETKQKQILRFAQDDVPGTFIAPASLGKVPSS